MLQQQISTLAQTGCKRIISKALHHRRNLRHQSSFFSSGSHAPKFPIPTYDGQTKPTPKISIPSSPSNGKQSGIADALRPSYEAQTPLLLQNLISNCDAIHFWRSVDYWRLAVGEDAAVDVEVGKGYNSGNRVTMSFGEYLNYLKLAIDIENKEYEEGKVQDDQHANQEVAYLAQNDLFDQVKNDLPIPQLCESGEYNVGEGKLYQQMLWMGPRNTVSPLHYDPLDNLLMQVVGWKRVLLFSPDGTEGGEYDVDGKKREMNTSSWHYAGHNGNQYNTSAVDVENPDHAKYPNFKASAPIPYECILGPGDGLYIPKHWWHHVRSLEMSISANVWWR